MAVTQHGQDAAVHKHGFDDAPSRPLKGRAAAPGPILTNYLGRCTGGCVGMLQARPFLFGRRGTAAIVALLLMMPLIWPGAVWGQSPAAPEGLSSQVSGQRAYQHVLEIAQ